MAHIEKRESGRWRARYRGPDGKERSKTFDRKVDAERFLTSVEGSKLRGDWVDPALGAGLVGEWAWRWLEAAAPSLKPKTAEGYASLLRSRVVPALGNHRLGALRPSTCRSG